MIGIITKPRSVQIWANSHHIVNETLQNLVKFTEENENVITTHKEERRSRLISDQEDRAKLQKFMSTCIHTFDTSVKELCNSYKSSCPEVFRKKGVLEKFTKFIGMLL